MNWNWLKSIIDAYRNKEITRERFEKEYDNAQIAMGIVILPYGWKVLK